MTFNELLQSSSIAADIIRTGGTAEDVAIGLYQHSQNLLNHVMEIEAIAPRRFRVGGRDLIYRCPDHLIPQDREGDR